MKLRPAYPYFGSKAAVAQTIWDALGDVPNYVEPFAGSAAVLLSRHRPGKVETINDIHSFIPNFLRAVREDPDGVADWAAWPVSEVDMHARHRWLVENATPEHVERMRRFPDYFDVQMAGWWVWGASCWIGAGWCDGLETEYDKRPYLIGGGHENHDARPKRGVGINRELEREYPDITGRMSKGQAANAGVLTQKRHPRLRGRDGQAQNGVGVFREDLASRLPHLIGPHNGRKLCKPGATPSLSGSSGEGVGYGRGIFASGRRENLRGYFSALAERLALVRITCGDWRRVCTPAVTISHGLTGVLLDPPYASERNRVYAHDSRTIALDVAEWAREHGEDPRMRIVLCGYEGEHDLPGWRVVAWKSRGGYGRGKSENASRERLWLSPHCVSGEQGDLFAAGGAP